jgi:gliding motility-associated-like protein
MVTLTATPNPLVLPLVATATISNTANPIGVAQNVWLFPDGTTQTLTTNTDVTWTATQPGEFVVQLTTTTTGGCSATDTVLIVVMSRSEVFIPNVFSPDGDGSNDIWTIQAQGVSDVEILIFDRWGNEISSRQVATPPADFRIPAWDGKHTNGQFVPEGVFVYMVRFRTLEGAEQERAGTITVVR